MIKRFIFWILPVFIFCALHGIQILSQEDVPDLYYYSQSQQAFLIQSADGQHTGILAHYELPENHRIAGAGWSPSGRWFAWYSFDERQLRPDSDVFILDRLTGEINKLAVNAGKVVEISWSPTSDVILFAHQVINEGASNSELIVSLMNVENQIVVEETFSNRNFHRFEWTPRGDSIVIYAQSTSGNVMNMLDLDGNSMERHFYQTSSPIFPSVYWSNNRVIYVQENQQTVVIEDMNTGDFAHFNFQDVSIQNIKFSPNGEYALIFTVDEPESGSDKVWFISYDDATIELIHDDVDSWLPQLSDTRYLTYDFGLLGRAEFWSPDSRYAVFRTNGGQLLLFDPLTISTYVVSPTQDGHVGSYWWMESNNNPQIVFEWEGASEDAMFAYSINNGQLKRLISTNSDETIYSPNISFAPSKSPSLRYLIFSWLRSCGFICVLDVINETPLSRIDSLLDATEGEFVPRGVLWNKSGEWFLLLNEYYGGIWIISANVTGEIQRGVGECSLSVACFGWMPRYVEN